MKLLGRTRVILNLVIMLRDRRHLQSRNKIYIFLIVFKIYVSSVKSPSSVSDSGTT